MSERCKRCGSEERAFLASASQSFIVCAACKNTIRLFVRNEENPVALLLEFADAVEIGAGEFSKTFLGRVKRSLHAIGVKSQLDVHEEWAKKQQ